MTPLQGHRIEFLMLKKIIIISLFFSSFSLLAQQENETEEYSTIQTEGQLVPVGEKNRYSFRYKKWNVWTNPFGFFFGNFSLGGSYAFNQNMKVNVAPDFIYFFASDPAIVGGGLTLSTSIFFKKVYDGFYLEPGARILYISQEETFGNGTVDGFAGGPQLIGGWAWIWDSGFNINLGLGMGYYFGQIGDNVEDTDTFDGIFPAGNLQFGYAF